MKYHQLRNSNHPASLQTEWKSVLLILVSLLTLTTSCSHDDNSYDGPMLTGIISSYNEFDGAHFDFTEALVQALTANEK